MDYRSRRTRSAGRSQRRQPERSGPEPIVFSVNTGGRYKRLFFMELETSIEFGQAETAEAHMKALQERIAQDIMTMMTEYPDMVVQDGTIALPVGLALCLRSYEGMPDEVVVPLTTIEGSIPGSERSESTTTFEYKVPLLRMNAMPGETLIAFRLYVLIPFHMFAYEDQLIEAQADPAKWPAVEEKLVASFGALWKALAEDQELSLVAKRDLVNSTKQTLEYLCDEHGWDDDMHEKLEAAIITKAGADKATVRRTTKPKDRPDIPPFQDE